MILKEIDSVAVQLFSFVLSFNNVDDDVFEGKINDERANLTARKL